MKKVTLGLSYHFINIHCPSSHPAVHPPKSSVHPFGRLFRRHLKLRTSISDRSPRIPLALFVSEFFPLFKSAKPEDMPIT